MSRWTSCSIVLLSSLAACVDDPCADQPCADAGCDDVAPDAGVTADAGDVDAGSFTPDDWTFWVTLIRDQRVDGRGTTNELGPMAEPTDTSSLTYWADGCFFTSTATFDPLHGHERAPEAGAITASTPGKPDLTVAPDAAGVYDYYVSYMGLPGWTMGDEITISATGGAVPAFELSLRFPAQQLLTSHDLAGDQPVALDASAPMVFTWEPTGGTFWIVLRQWPNDPSADVILQATCQVPGSLGRFEFPTEILDLEFDTAAGHPKTDLSFGARRSVRAREGGYDVVLELISAVSNLARFDG